jgi:hypothetical protein
MFTSCNFIPKACRSWKEVGPFMLPAKNQMIEILNLMLQKVWP